MKISIVTVVYNGAGFIEENILSVKDQDYPDIEHVIIDGGSTDGTVDIIKKYAKESKESAGSYDLKWVSEKDRGIYDAFNKGFRMATGDIYAWVDGDNYLESGIVRKVVDIFEKEKCDLVYGDIEFVGAGRTSKIHKAPVVTFRNALMKNTGAIPLQPAVFFKKELYEKTGEFDLQYRIAADYDFWMRALKTDPKLYYYPATFGAYRKGDAAASQSVAGIMRGYNEMVAIGDVYGRPWYGKIFLTIKYSLAILKTFI